MVQHETNNLSLKPSSRSKDSTNSKTQEQRISERTEDPGKVILVDCRRTTSNSPVYIKSM